MLATRRVRRIEAYQDVDCVAVVREHRPVLTVLSGDVHYDQSCLDSGALEIASLLRRAESSLAAHYRAVQGTCASSNCEVEVHDLLVDLRQVVGRSEEMLSSLRSRCGPQVVEHWDAPRSDVKHVLVGAERLMLGTGVALFMSALSYQAIVGRGESGAGTAAIASLALGFGGTSVFFGILMMRDTGRSCTVSSWRSAGLVTAAISYVGGLLGWAITEAADRDARVPVMAVLSVAESIGGGVALGAWIAE